MILSRPQTLRPGVPPGFPAPYSPRPVSAIPAGHKRRLAVSDRTMIGISKLYCGQVEPSDALRYGRQSGNLPSHLLQFSKDKKPVVVWNMTKRCNLKCVHCYAQAVPVDGADDISTEQAKAMIDDLAAYGAPVMLFSGGEPWCARTWWNWPAMPPPGACAPSSPPTAPSSPRKRPVNSRAWASPTWASPWTAWKKCTTASAACPAPSARPWKAWPTARPKA